VVVLREGAVTIGTLTLDTGGQATLKVGNLTPGTHTIVASYGGDTNFAPSDSAPVAQKVRQPTTTVVTATPGAPFYGQTITLVATIGPQSAGSRPGGTVSFDDNGQSLGTATLDANGRGRLTIATLGIGKHNIGAAYAGDTNYGASDASPLALKVRTRLYLPVVAYNP
jgi:hypothetical protein